MIAKELKVPVVALSQLSRAPEQRPGAELDRDQRAAPELDLAVVRLGGSRQDAHERGLARAVHADQADPLPLLDGEGEPVEDGAAAEREAEPGRVEERHRAFIAPARRRRGPERAPGVRRGACYPPAP